MLLFWWLQNTNSSCIWTVTARSLWWLGICSWWSDGEAHVAFFFSSFFSLSTPHNPQRFFKSWKVSCDFVFGMKCGFYIYFLLLFILFCIFFFNFISRHLILFIFYINFNHWSIDSYCFVLSHFLIYFSNFIS